MGLLRALRHARKLTALDIMLLEESGFPVHKLLVAKPPRAFRGAIRAFVRKTRALNRGLFELLRKYYPELYHEFQERAAQTPLRDWRKIEKLFKEFREKVDNEILAELEERRGE